MSMFPRFQVAAERAAVAAQGHLGAHAAPHLPDQLPVSVNTEAFPFLRGMGLLLAFPRCHPTPSDPTHLVFLNSRTTIS
jgi:hypothetical protein